jgi:hypothetical protein
MSQKSINDLNLNSITISNSNYSNSKGYTAQSNTLETNNSGVLLVNGVPISSGGGGGTLTTYSLTTNTPLVPVNTLTSLFATEVYPPSGTYIVSSTVTFNGYDTNGDPVNIISAVSELIYAHDSFSDHVVVTITYSNVVIPSNTFTIQTCGIFTSDGLGELLVNGKVIELDTDGTQYNVVVANAPQVQLIKIA